MRVTSIEFIDPPQDFREAIAKANLKDRERLKRLFYSVYKPATNTLFGTAIDEWTEREYQALKEKILFSPGSSH